MGFSILTTLEKCYCKLCSHGDEVGIRNGVLYCFRCRKGMKS